MVDNWVQRAVFITAAVLAFMFGASIVFVASWTLIKTGALTDAMLAAVVGSYTGAAGFIFGMLVNMRTGGQPEEPPQQVEIVNKPADPVPTVEAPDAGQTVLAPDLVPVPKRKPSRGV